MNIGLIGTPGAGKSGLAQQLAGELGGVVLDNYVPEIEQKSQIALGPIADYLGNMYVALERYVRERRLRMDHEVVITCGTFIETAVYMAMHFVALSDTLSDEDKLEAAPRVDAVLRMLAVLYNDIVTYDHAFYLPATGGDEGTAFMDQQLQAGLEGFKLISVTALNSSETRLTDALAVIRSDA